MAEVRETDGQTGVSGLDNAVLMHDPQASGAWGDSKRLQHHLLTVTSEQREVGCNLRQNNVMRHVDHKSCGQKENSQTG
eukprot:CAMPEP_0174369898 /NCGR_PEP_ID=MMETSP0811_2-20130205/94203_1 /TAXON_ID=73025 ORGANISM="Eutreptiella gymnastica-like, Strain CCMP1594" /NCGR_SAMPLE_ID=MMETSP0811_2 /ASSEMBLY_ACC=CAM_ASM_000667 /LENGTH=78 /DNA_ID=CAMNT_0015514813 /DNA_START=61 /DNA_END=297 /DNA_ORIENTATION=+